MEGLWPKFKEYKQELFSEAIIEIQSGNVTGGIEIATQQWETWRSTIGRNRRDKDALTILDIFGYEARAAIHRCYSSLWEGLTDWIYQRSGSDPNTHAFHHLWHRDITWPANEPEAIEADRKFHLLHGHIFGLHPAASDFVETTTGRKLIFDWFTADGKDWKLSLIHI